MTIRPDCPECGTRWAYTANDDGVTYSRIVGQSHNDRIVGWVCPDCDHHWERNDPALIWRDDTPPDPAPHSTEEHV